MKKQNIVVLGGSELQIPIINYLIGLNDYNILIFDNNTSCLASKIKLVNFVNMSNTNHVKISEYLNKKNILIHAIITNSDKAIYAKSILDKKYKLDGINEYTALLSFDKSEQLKYCVKHCIKHPLHFLINKNTDLNKINIFPGVLKPVQSSGSRDVIRINDFNELEIEFSKLINHKYDSLLYQEYIAGEEVSIEGFVIKGKTNIIGITQKIKFESSKYFVESGHIFPAEIDILTEKKIINFVNSLLNPLGLISTPFHVEVKVTDHRIILIEFALRLGGDFITSKLIPLSTGINPIEILSKIILNNNDYNLTPKKSIQKVGISYGQDIMKFKNIIEDKLNFKKNTIKNSLDRSGYIIGYL